MQLDNFDWRLKTIAKSLNAELGKALCNSHVLIVLLLINLW